MIREGGGGTVAQCSAGVVLGWCGGGGLRAPAGPVWTPGECSPPSLDWTTKAVIDC